MRLRLERRRQRLGHISIMLTAGRKLAEIEAKRQQRLNEIMALETFLTWQESARITEEYRQAFYTAKGEVASDLIVPLASIEGQCEWAVTRLAELKTSEGVYLHPC